MHGARAASASILVPHYLIAIERREDARVVPPEAGDSIFVGSERQVWKSLEEPSIVSGVLEVESRRFESGVEVSTGYTAEDTQHLRQADGSTWSHVDIGKDPL